jgi:hypothetical protein
MTDKYFTIVFKDLTSEERVALWNSHPGKISASSHSHVMDDRDQLLDALSYAECALGDIGDADREPGDDLEWCERRAAEALPRIRKMLLAHGKTTTATTAMTTPTLDEISKLVSFTQMNDGKWSVGEIYGDVHGRIRGEIHGSISGTVFGNVYGSVDGSVRGDVRRSVGGTIGGRKWTYAPSAKDLLIAAIRGGDTAKALDLIDEALPND